MNIWFVVNPVSGPGNDIDSIQTRISDFCTANQVPHSVHLTRKPGHAAQIAKTALDAGADVVTAVGGDGTIHEVGTALIDTDAALAIIPHGSGNGIANHYGILNTNVSTLSTILSGRTKTIDTATINGVPFIGFAGIGFDAVISDKFATFGKRGPWPYIQISAQELFSYKPERYELEIDGDQYETDAFLITVANTSEYGNHAKISPQSSSTDGWLDVCILKPFPLTSSGTIAFDLFQQRLPQNRHMTYYRGQQIKIRRERPGPVHYDGEPDTMDETLHINIRPASLNVRVPQ